MPLDTFVSGAYSHTYNSVDTGITHNGYDLQIASRGEPVGPSDVHGQSVIDLVYRGGDVHIQYDSMAYKAGAITPFWPWAAIGTVGVIGRLGSNVAATALLTSTAGTPAAAAPTTVTGTKAILAENFDARLLFHSVLRSVPTRLRLLPYDAGSGTIKWFVTA